MGLHAPAHLRLRTLKSRPQSKPRSPNCVLFASFQPSNFGFGVFLVNISLHDLEKGRLSPRLWQDLVGMLSWYLKVANNSGVWIVVPTIWSEVHSRRDTLHLQSIFPLNLVDQLFTKDNSTRNKFNLSFVDILIFEFRLRWPRGTPVSHPCNGTTSTPPRLLTLPPNHSTSNGTLRWHPAMGPRPLHPAVAPWCHVQSAKWFVALPPYWKKEPL